MWKAAKRSRVCDLVVRVALTTFAHAAGVREKGASKGGKEVRLGREGERERKGESEAGGGKAFEFKVHTLFAPAISSLLRPFTGEPWLSSPLLFLYLRVFSL